MNFFMGIKRLLLEPQKYRTKELIVFYLFGVIQNLRLEFWRI
nr:MAG TPA: hypothetical protein [Caudoviricetes sp.]